MAAKKRKQKEFIAPIMVIIQGEVKISAKDKKEAMRKATEFYTTGKPEVINSTKTRVHIFF